MAQTTTLDALEQTVRPRFDRNELGSVRGYRNRFSLIVGTILAAKTRPGQRAHDVWAHAVADRLAYGLPMPAQPLKAMAVLVIAGKASANMLYGGGAAIGVIMLLTVTGLIDWLGRS